MLDMLIRFVAGFSLVVSVAFVHAADQPANPPATLLDGNMVSNPSFEFDCSGGGVCDLDSIRVEQARIKAAPRGIHAPCGSVKVQQLDWQTGTMPDAIHPGEIVMDFVLNVYTFGTTAKPGADTCQKKS